MQVFHEYLTDELGVNEYVSYVLYVGMFNLLILFVINLTCLGLTIVTGLVLGGIMVCITDMINTRRRQRLQAQVKYNTTLKILTLT